MADPQDSPVFIFFFLFETNFFFFYWLELNDPLLLRCCCCFALCVCVCVFHFLVLDMLESIVKHIQVEAKEIGAHTLRSMLENNWDVPAITVAIILSHTRSFFFFFLLTFGKGVWLTSQRDAYNQVLG